VPQLGVLHTWLLGVFISWPALPYRWRLIAQGLVWQLHRSQRPCIQVAAGHRSFPVADGIGMARYSCCVAAGFGGLCGCITAGLVRPWGFALLSLEEASANSKWEIAPQPCYSAGFLESDASLHDLSQLTALSGYDSSCRL